MRHKFNKVKPIEMSKLNEMVRLPDDLTMKGAGSKLHQIGLSLFVIESSKRRALHNPFFFFIFAWTHTIRCFSAMILPKEEDRIFFLIGDYPHYMNIGLHYNISYMFCGFIIISLQSIHFLYYWRDIKPSYLKPFGVISGSISPSSTGLYGVTDVVKFAKYAKLFLRLTEPYIRFFTIAAGSISMSLLVIANSWYDMFFISIPWVIFHIIAAYIFCALLSYQLIYFHLICYYLRLKLRQLNTRVKTTTTFITDSMSDQLIQSVDSTHSEISEFNRNFWSDFLCVFSGLLIIALTTSLYALIFGDLPLIMKTFLGVVDSFFLLILGIVLQDSSSISYEAFKSYKHLANLFCSKNYQANIGLSNKLKLLVIFEIIGQRKVGFYCWKLFVFNYFRMYEIIGLTLVFLLKIIQTAQYKNY